MYSLLTYAFYSCPFLSFSYTSLFIPFLSHSFLPFSALFSYFSLYNRFSIFFICAVQLCFRFFQLSTTSKPLLYHQALNQDNLNSWPQNRPMRWTLQILQTSQMLEIVLAEFPRVSALYLCRSSDGRELAERITRAFLRQSGLHIKRINWILADLKYVNRRYFPQLPYINPLTAALNPSAQRCVARFFSGNFSSWTVHFVNICVKNQQMQQLFIQFIDYVW
jgi:hypothetical protein